MFDYDALESKLKTAVRATLSECLETRPNEDFFAFLLTALDPPHWFGAAINSEQHHARVMQANSVSVHAPEEEHFRWQPCEWGEYESVGCQHFERINAEFGEPLYSADSAFDYDAHLQEVIKRMTAALRSLDDVPSANGGSIRDNLILYVHIHDSNAGDEAEEQSGRALNRGELLGRFASRYERLIRQAGADR